MAAVFCVTLLATICALIYVYFKHAFTYWKRRNVPQLPDPKIPMGHLASIIKTESLGENIRRFYNEFKKMGEKTHGGVYMFAAPTYMPLDLDIIKSIIITDHNHFLSRGAYNNPNEPTTESLFSLAGERWKNVRTKLSPTFTSGKMKRMFELMEKTSSMLVKEIEKLEDTEFCIKKVAMKFTINVIGSCAFGIECNAFDKEESEFVKQANLFIKKPHPLTGIKKQFCNNFTNISRKLNLRLFNDEINNFFNDLVREITTHRIKNKEDRNDFMQLLLEVYGNGKNSEELDLEKDFDINSMIAQAFVFFVAGFETSSSAMSFALLELANHPDIQEKARREVQDVLKKHKGQYTYDSIMEMKYLTQVVEETLRLYPSLPVLTRRCTKTYKEPKTGLIIEKDTMVAVSLIGIHRDPDYFPDPETYDPERFSEENKKHIDPCQFMPFGQGGRLCIGLRFGMMQAKLGLAKLLMAFRFHKTDKTTYPIKEFDTTFLLSVKGDIVVRVTKV